MTIRARTFVLVLAATLTLAAPVVRAASPPVAAHVPAGFTIERIATVRGARELAVTPSGDLIVGTSGAAVALVADAQGTPAAPATFAVFDDAPAAGVFLSADSLYVGTRHGVYRVAYQRGDRVARAAPQKIAAVRTGGGGGHATTSVAVSDGTLYASVGSSCNACAERDPTRATVQAMTLDGATMHARAVGIRNAIALAVNPVDGGVWAGVAGRDDLEPGHPYEIFDDLSAHAGTPDYGWLTCADRTPIGSGSCAGVVVPRAVFPAYDTPIGAVFYPAQAAGRYAFPAAFRGGAFVALHGSWHQPPVAPRVAFVPFSGGLPSRAVDWANPAAQWDEFVGCLSPAGTRVCRPTGVAVGSDGSLFVSEDSEGAIYRIRPSGR